MSDIQTDEIENAIYCVANQLAIQNIIELKKKLKMAKLEQKCQSKDTRQELIVEKKEEIEFFEDLLKRAEYHSTVNNTP